MSKSNVHPCSACFEIQDAPEKYLLSDSYKNGNSLSETFNFFFHIELDIDTFNYICGSCMTKIDTVYDIYCDFIKANEDLYPLASFVKKEEIDSAVEVKNEVLAEVEVVYADKFDSIEIGDEDEKDLVKQTTHDENIIDEEDGQYEEYLEEYEPPPKKAKKKYVYKKKYVKKPKVEKEKIDPAAIEAQKRKCYICKTTFPTEKEYSDHFPQHYGLLPFSCTLCDGKEFVRAKTLSTHLALHDEEDRRHKCGYCNIRFRTDTGKKNHEYKEHLTKHVEKKVVECQCIRCGKLCMSKALLRLHEFGHREPENKTKCKICSKTFAFPTSLRTHMTIHTQERPFKCELCGKSFRLRYDLTEHTRIHTGECPYECSICLKRFNSRSTLRHHKKRHMEA